MLPEVVNWKTGGVLRSLGSLGLIKGDVNGLIQGAHSPNSVPAQVVFLVYVPEGVEITKYQFLELHKHKDAREFRAVTGGVLHASGGVLPADIIPFDFKKVAPRTLEIVESLAPGEYGLLPPGATVSRNASGTLGKMYTFRVIE